MIKVDSFSFQGVNGAYSEQAGKNIFPNATSIPCATFEDMFEHVRSGKSEAVSYTHLTLPTRRFV